MKVDELRVYSEVLEQGLDFKEYLNSFSQLPVKNIYTKKLRGEFSTGDSLIARIRRVKNIDVLITAVSGNAEYPILLVEYSTAVPTDDHKMQRSDVYYWSAVFKTPMMKISSDSKGVNKSFGKGTKLKAETEIAMACKKNAVLYYVPWENEEGKDVLAVKENALSCIAYRDVIRDKLKYLLESFVCAESFEKWFDSVSTEYFKENRAIFDAYTDEKIKEVITESSRFKWFGTSLRVKINRFGHAMDPDKGILYFANMLLGAENVITEIQVNRPGNYACKGGYAALFDKVSQKSVLERYVKDIIKNGNVFSDENAIYVFKTALNIDDALNFQKTSEGNYIISDDDLFCFLISRGSMTAKSIFFLSTELQLTDKYRNVICTVKWNKEPSERFLKSISNVDCGVTDIEPLCRSAVQEDVITFASVELYKRLKYELLAVSYPGAQGDRCVLTGCGRGALRTYIDIIAYKNSQDGVSVYLEECKECFADSREDAVKLKRFKNDEEKINGLKTLFKKTVGIENFSRVYTAVAAKATPRIPNFDVDYIFMFDIEDGADNKTLINYAVAIVDLTLACEFSLLKNTEGKLKGTIELDKLYCIR